MKAWKILLPVAASLLLAGPTNAQDSDEEAERIEREIRVQREVARVQAEEQKQVERFRKVEREEARARMVEAERQLEEAARRIAELSERNLSGFRTGAEAFFSSDDKPRLGVTIGGRDSRGPVEGVMIAGVSPGTAANDAGLRAGDVITAINGDSMSADDSSKASEKLLDFMKGVETGDVLTIEYLRDGSVGTVEVEPRQAESRAFIFRTPGAPNAPNVQVFPPSVHVDPDAVADFRYEFKFPWVHRGFGDMEMVELSEDLGKYFGADKGLLVISAPDRDDLKLKDGDVIQSIDGREPTSVGHAMRILGSYQPGESLELRILRNKKRQTLKIEMPDDRTGQLLPLSPMAPEALIEVVPVPASAPVAPVPEQAPLLVVPDEDAVIVIETRT